MNIILKFLSTTPILISLIFFPKLLMAASSDEIITLNMITSPVGIFCLLLFIVAYGFVMAEEFTHYRKSKPVIIAATFIWGFIAYAASSDPSLSTNWAEQQFRHVILEFAELFFFSFCGYDFC